MMQYWRHLRYSQRSTFLLGLLLMTVGSVRLAAQDVYVTSWVIQDPESGFVQDVAARTINAINLWVTRENVAAQTARLDDRLEITLVGRYSREKNVISEEIVRIRAGSLLIEDDPALYLSRGLLDTLIRRNYRWNHGGYEILDQTRAPRYAIRDTAVRTRLEASDDLADPYPLPTIVRRLSGKRTLFLDPGDHRRQLPGLSLGAVRFGVAFSMGEVWGELPLPNGMPALFGPSQSAGFGVGAALNLGNLRVASGTDFDRPGDDSTVTDLARIGTWLTLQGTATPGSVGPYETRVDVGGHLREVITSGPKVNGVVSEMSSLTILPLARVSLSRWSSNGGLYLEQTAFEATSQSMILSGRLRVNESIHISGAFAAHGYILERDSVLPSLTLWLSPGITF